MTKKTEGKSPPLPELFFGIVARMGVDVSKIVTNITGEAAKYNYHVVHFKVTSMLKLMKSASAIVETPIEKRYGSYINACNKVRENTEDPSVFARTFVSWLSVERDKVQKEGYRGIIYIIDQLKRPEEIELLRSIYSDAFFCLSCHAPYQTRERNLTNKIISSHGASDSGKKWDSEAKSLIELDESEEGDFGQNVRVAFPKADYIVDAKTDDSIRKDINRLYKLIFSDPALSPNFQEHGNNLAAQAAYRSIDLSRQVGAAILSDKKTIISLGCNEVPRAGGGTYWTGDTPDRRDQDLGYDANTIQKQELVIDVVQKLKEAELLDQSLDEYDYEGLKNKLLSTPKAALKDAEILSITEYGRSLHAEMNAITDASRTLSSTQGATLFVTTFPCHNCAKHIVGAGIQQVWFLEPYPKSQVSKLYPDSIEVDPENCRETHVSFSQFCGVTKRRYHYFSKERLKDKSGSVFPWSEKSARCLVDRQPIDYHRLETLAISKLNENQAYLSDLKKTGS